jgi:CRISPR-associated endonuclease/helicase Cas3
MCLSNGTSALWAKKPKTPVTGRNLWLPLHSHMSDAAEIARKIWENWLPPGTKKEIASGVSLLERADDECLAEKVFVFLAAAHDLGKASPVFQSKGLSAKTRLDEILRQNILDAGFPLKNNLEYSERAAARHSLVSHLILERHGFDVSVSVVAGAHHGMPPSSGELENIRTHAYDSNCGFDDERWRQAQEELLNYALDLAGLSKSEAGGLKLKKTAQVLLSALVILADWISSDEDKFPLSDVESCQNMEHSPDRAEKAWEALNFTHGWNVTQDWDDLYSRRFAHIENTRPLQEIVLNVVKNCHAPGIVVIEAPMGEGKTEAALAAAEVLANLSKRGGLLFALPTQATSDAMLDRVLNWIKHFDPDYDKHSFLLAHGKADFNERYAKIKLSAHTHVGGDEENDEKDRENVIVHEWFSGRKKGILADFVVGTIDQLLMAGLRQKHVMLRHLGLANKVVIIDECHAYDAYMGSYLFKVLSWLGAYGVPVIVLSATLPSERRKGVIDAYLNKNSTPKQPDVPWKGIIGCPPERHEWMDSREYPLVTYTDGGEVEQEPAGKGERQLVVSIRQTDDDKIADKLDELLSGGGCAGIMVNTVRRAQKFYGDICKRFGDECVRLLHSRFIALDRASKENELMGMLGPPNNSKRPEKLIVVGTQVLEQSLDLDFDLLITDLSPMDLLIQRIGRLHRHDRDRPAELKDAVCYVLGASGKDFESGSQKIYGKYLLMRTKALLPEKITLPDDIPTLVQNTYGEDDSFMVSLDAKEYAIARKDWSSLMRDKEARAKEFQIFNPIESKRARLNTIVGLLDMDVKDSSEKRGEAEVRDETDSIEVIVIGKKGEELCLLPWIERFGGVKIPDGNDIRDDELERAIAGCSVRLPRIFSGEQLAEKVISELKQICQNEKLGIRERSPWLRKELFLILDEDYKTKLGGFQLEYDKNKGLISE